MISYARDKLKNFITLRQTNLVTLLKRNLFSLVVLLGLTFTSLVFAVCTNKAGIIKEVDIPVTPSSVPEIAKVRIALAVTDISVGRNRLTFGLIEKGEGPLRNIQIFLNTFYLDGEKPNERVESLEPTYIEWPTGKGGVYTTTANFTQSGRWGLGVVFGSDDNMRTASAFIEVSASSMAPTVGTIPPHSTTKSLSQGYLIKSITSDPNPYTPFYELTLQQALNSGLPSLVVFATPAYCVTATCGPQLEIIKDLHKSHGDRINFIHIETYENPQDIKGDLSKGIISAATRDWNLPSEPWTFLINSEGIIIERYEGLVTTNEILEILPSLR